MFFSWVSTFQGAEHICLIPVDLRALAILKGCSAPCEMELKNPRSALRCLHTNLRQSCVCAPEGQLPPKVEKQVEWKAIFLTDILTVFAFKVYVHIKI